MKPKPRSLRDIRTLGNRTAPVGDHGTLLRASVLEAELQRLRQERYLLEQRMEVLDRRAHELQMEKQELLESLEGRSARTLGQRQPERPDRRRKAVSLRY